MKEHLIRQFDLIPETLLGKEVHIIGAGAIGSCVVMSLVKMGFLNLTVYDFDTVSIENMNSQWYRPQDIGKPKVEALKALVKDFTNSDINTISDAFDGSQRLKGLVISSVDSMKARRLIWKSVKGNHLVTHFIDPRMAAEYALSFVMRPNDEKDQSSYEKTLYSDENSVQEPCTAKATMYTSMMIGGYVAKHVKDIVTKKPYARITHWDIGLNDMQSWKMEAPSEITARTS